MVTVEQNYEVLSRSLRVDSVGGRKRSGGDNTACIIKPSVCIRVVIWHYIILPTYKCRYLIPSTVDSYPFINIRYQP